MSVSGLGGLGAQATPARQTGLVEPKCTHANDLGLIGPSKLEPLK